MALQEDVRRFQREEKQEEWKRDYRRLAQGTPEEVSEQIPHGRNFLFEVSSTMEFRCRWVRRQVIQP